MLNIRLAFISLGLVGMVLLTQCAGNRELPSPPVRHVPRVSMPEMGGLSEHERQFLPEVEDVLVRAGFLPTRGGGEYRLEFRLSDGLVNADSFLRILSGDTEVAAAKARSGGVSTLFRRTRAVEESFHRCLADFESQLAGAAGGFREDRRPALPQAPVSGQEADWQRGW